jgi:hypothetical protein
MEKQYLCPFPGAAADGIADCHPVRFVRIKHMFTVGLNYCRFYAFPYSSQNCLLLEVCACSALCGARLSFQTNTVMLPLTLTQMPSPSLVQVLCCVSLVLQILIFFIVRLSNKYPEEKKLAMYSLCPTTLTLLQRSLTIACEAVSPWSEHLPFPK